MKQNSSGQVKNRRKFLRSSLAAGAVGTGAAILGQTKLLARDNNRLTRGDTAVLRSVAAAELIETDLWVQYAVPWGLHFESIRLIAEFQRKVRDPPPCSPF